MAEDLKRFCSGVVAMRLARKAMDQALMLAENEADTRGPEDRKYPTPARPVCRQLRTAIAQIDAVLNG